LRNGRELDRTPADSVAAVAGSAAHMKRPIEPGKSFNPELTGLV
jgi:hypothetical protein